MQPFEEAAFLAFSQHEPGVSKEALSKKQARELSIAVRCVSLVGEALLLSICVQILVTRTASHNEDTYSISGLAGEERKPVNLALRTSHAWNGHTKAHANLCFPSSA